MSSAGCAHRRDCRRELLLRLRDSVLLRSRIAKWLYRHAAQSVCPWNTRFAQELQTPEFAPREVLAGKDARTLARELLGMSQEEFSAAFKGSPMKRAKLRGLKRNAAVVLGNVGDDRDIDVVAAASSDADPLVHEHARWALARIASRRATPGIGDD